MTTLRHKQRWLIWLLGLTLVVTGVLSPTQAFACADLPAAAAVVQAEGHQMACSDLGQEASCCCAPRERVAEANLASAAALTEAGCGCSMEAPEAPPTPAAKSFGLLLQLDQAILPVTALSVELPDFKIWEFAAPATGPPIGPLHSSGPSRAPPAL